MTTRALDRLVQAASAAARWLAPGADLARIAAAEEALGQRFPAALKELYARHDGERLPPGVTEGLLSQVRFLSLDELCAVAAERRQRPRGPSALEVRGAVEPVTWSDGWLPFARDFGDNFLAVDCAPVGGEVGQVLSLGFDDGRLEVLAPSLQAYLDDEAAAVESGARPVEVGEGGHAVTVRLGGVAQWKPGQVVPVPGHDVSVRVVDPLHTGPAGRAMRAGLCVVVSAGAVALDFVGCPRLGGARLVEAGAEVSLGLGTASVSFGGQPATCVLLPTSGLSSSTELELQLQLSHARQ